MKKYNYLIILPLLVLQVKMFSQVPKIQLGSSTYDLQTNNSIQRRIVVDPVTKNITITYTGSSATDGSYADRGTGYAYYDKANNVWKDRTGANLVLPVTSYPGRIENVRTGWPNPLNVGSKELIFSHISDGSFNGINMATRTRGTTNAWTNTKITAGKETWPRAASDGKNIVVISSYFQSTFEGVDAGIQFMVSKDSGATWSNPAAFTGMDAINYPKGVGGDIYDVDIKGNTIAILMGRLDISLYKSTDMGTTWTKSSIFSTQDNIDDNASLNVKRGDKSDGSFSVIIDKNNKIHCFWGVQTSFISAGSAQLDLSRHGIGYWNEYMGVNTDPYIVPQTFFLREGNFAKSPIGRFNTTLNDGTTAGYFGSANVYGHSPVTWPSSGLDSNGGIYLTYAYNRGKIDSTPSGSGVDADKNGYNLYDVYAVKSLDSGKTWIGPYNISQTKSLESTYPSMAKFVDNNIYVVYQEDSLAGGAVGGTPGSGSHLPGPIHTPNKILFAKVPVDSIKNPINTFNQAPLLTVKNIYKDSAITSITNGGKDTNTFLFLTYVKGCNKDLYNQKAFDHSKTTFLKNYVEIYDDAVIDSNNLTIIVDSAININTPGRYGYRVFVKDNQGAIGTNAGFVYLDTLFVSITVIDDIIAPKLILNGSDTVNIFINTTYTDEGVTVLGDNNPCYVIGSATTSTTVNTSVVGSYEVTYTIKDNANNTAILKRTVNVLATFINQVICEGDTFLKRTTSGTYIDTIKVTNNNGLDIIRTLNLTVNPKTYSTINQTMCLGQAYLGRTTSGTYIDTLKNSNSKGCDSIRTLNLTVNPKTYSTINQTICLGQTYLGRTTSGVYIDTLIGANSKGCDSIRTLNLTVNPKTYSTINQTICLGQTYLGRTTSGTYIDTLKNANNKGCDSIRTLKLTVENVPIITDVISGSPVVCQGQNNVTYSISNVSNNPTSYLWTLPTNFFGTSQTNQIAINFPINASPGTLSVLAINKCGNSNIVLKNILVNPKPAKPTISNSGNSLISSSLNGNQWYDLNGIINGANNTVYVGVPNNSYYVVVTEQGCSSDPSNIISLAGSSITNDEKHQLLVFPVPFENDLYITATDNEEKEYSLTTIEGKVLLSGRFKKGYIVNTKSISKGTYILTIISKDKREHFKVVKN